MEATFSCVIIGLALSFIKNRKSAILPAVSGGIGTITLLMLKSKIDNDVLREGGGMILVQVEYTFGFYAILILMVAAVGLNIYVFFGKDDAT